MRLARRELFAWAALLALAALWRLPGLGERAASHDESLHAYYAWRFAELGEYRHDPMLHGPLLFHLGAAVFALLGDSEATARLPVALAGIALVAAPLLFRRELGRRGALAAGALLLISPSIAYYSRYLRNDVYVALLSLLWLRALFDARVPRGERALGRLALFLALACATKEVAFLVGGAFGGLLLVEAAGRRLRGEPAGRPFDLALFQLALVSPYLAGAARWAAGEDPADADAPGALAATLGWAAAIASPSLGVALLRFRRTWPAAARALPRCFALAWGLLLALYTGLGTALGHGVVSGVSGSLGYWLEQHGVGRGAQPPFYYGMLGLLYEPLPWALALTAGFALLRRPRGRTPEPAPLLPRFLAGWCVIGWAAFTLAGEKMPWLLVHLALPAILLAGWWLGARSRLPAGEPDAREACGLLGAGGALAVTLLVAAGLAVRGVEGPAGQLRATLLALLLGGLAVAAARLRRRGNGALRRGLALTVLAAAGLLGARAALLASFVHDELAVEPLVYAHGTEQIAPALAELERASRRLAGGLGLELAVDSETSWPLAWHLRRWTAQRSFEGTPDEAVLAAPALIAGDAQDRALRARLAFARERLPFDLVRWPPETYRDWTPGRALAALGDPAAWRRGLALFFFRERPNQALDPWPLRKAAALYLPRSAPGAGVLDPLPLLDWPREPAAAPPPGGGGALAPDGRRFEADRERHVVRAFDADGRLLAESRRESLPLDLPGPLAWDAQRGQLWIADVGRRRLVALDGELAFVEAVEAPLWERDDLPGLACLPGGGLVASVPRGDALVVWDAGHRPRGVIPLDPRAAPGALEATAEGRLRVATAAGVVELTPAPLD